VAHNDFALTEQLWQEWSPGWNYPPESLEADRAMFRQPASLTAALNYYRHSFNIAYRDPPCKRTASATVNQSFYPRSAFMGSRTAVGGRKHRGDGRLVSDRPEKRIIAGAGHFVHQEQPDEVNRLVLEFIR
jgi:pimeloyl-ACP methyl ester carboxylesterase